MHIRQLLTQDQLNNFDESIALELIQKIEKGNIQNLSCSFLSVRAETVVLIAAALAHCPNLHTVNMANNNLGQYGPATAEKLALAPSLHTVYMGNNNLGEHGPATAAAFDSHNQYLADLKQTIHTPSMFTTVLNPDGMPPDVVDFIGVFLPPIDATVY